MYIKLIRPLLNFVMNHPFWVMGFLILSSGYSLYFASKLGIRGDFKALVPEHFESVQNLNKVDEHFGGVSHLFVVVQADNIQKSMQFVDEVTPEIETIPNVNYVLHKLPINYIKKRLPLFIDLEDLKEIDRRISHALKNSKKGGSVFFSNMLDLTDPEDSAALDLSDIEEKYQNKWFYLIGTKSQVPEESPENKKLLQAGTKNRTSRDPIKEGYYYGSEDKILVMLVKPTITFLDLDENKKLIAAVKNKLDALNKAKYNNSITYDFTGSYQTLLDQSKYLKDQFIRVFVVIFILLGLVMTLFYRNIATSFLIGIPLAMAISWAGAMTYFLIGHINLVTGFTAFVILGLGSDYGIFLLSRYRQERAKGKSIEESMRDTYFFTGRANLSAYLTTLAGFIALTVSQFRGFSEFGLVGACGMTAAFIAMLLVLPCLLLLMEHYDLFNRGKISFKNIVRFKKFLIWSKVVRYPRFFAVASGLFLVYSLIVLPGKLHVEYDYKGIENRNLISEGLERKVRGIIHQPIRPPSIVTESPEHERLVVQALKKKEKYLKDFIFVDKFKPSQQEEKRVLAARILKNFKQLETPIRYSMQEFLERFEELKNVPAALLEDIPKNLTKMFFPFKKGEGIYSLVFLFPADGINLGSSEGIKAFTNEMKKIDLENKTSVSANGESFILADILFLVEREGPRALLYIFILLTLILILDFHSLKKVLIILFSILSTVPLLVGCMSLFGLDFNIFNVCMVPIIFAIGIDGFIHYYHRYDEGGLNMGQVSESILPSIFIATFTSLIGFGGFIVASTQYIRSMGWLSILGISMIFIMVSVAFPAWLSLIDRGKRFVQDWDYGLEEVPEQSATSDS